MGAEKAWLRSNGCGHDRFFIEPLNLTSLLYDTPLRVLLPSFNKTASTLETGRYRHNNIANAVRVALLFKYGGAYLDLDMISVRPLRVLPCNCLGSQEVMTRKIPNGPGSTNVEGGRGDGSANIRHGQGGQKKKVLRMAKMNNAALLFDRHHSFLVATMRLFVKDFQPRRWGYQGPHLMTRVYKRKFTNFNGDKNGTSGRINKSHNGTTGAQAMAQEDGKAATTFSPVLPLQKKVFYPIGFHVNLEIKPFYVRPASNNLLESGFSPLTVAVHLWFHHASEWLNRPNGGWTLHPESPAALLTAACLRPNASLGPPWFHPQAPADSDTPYLLCPDRQYCG
jgi:hypothetical protein